MAELSALLQPHMGTAGQEEASPNRKVGKTLKRLAGQLIAHRRKQDKQTAKASRKAAKQYQTTKGTTPAAVTAPQPAAATSPKTAARQRPAPAKQPVAKAPASASTASKPAAAKPVQAKAAATKTATTKPADSAAA